MSYMPGEAGVAPFKTELEARRHAMDNYWYVKFVPYREELR